MALSGLQSSIENTRAHLQKQLRTKEADLNRMAVQIRVSDWNLASLVNGYTFMLANDYDFLSFSD